MKNNALRELRDRYSCPELERYDDEFPVDVGKVAQTLGIQLFGLDLPGDISGKIYHKDNKICVELNKREHPYRMRFTLAHELGHYLLHKKELDKEGQILERSSYTLNDKKMESQANQFAARLLMPSYKIKELFRNHNMIPELSDYFQVSEIALGFRLMNMGISYV